MRWLAACSFVGWCLVMSLPARGATITVTTTTDELNETSPDGSCSLREALYSANHNFFPAGDCTAGSAIVTDVIVLAATTYTFGGAGSTTHGSGEELGRTGDLDILESVTIQGQGVTTTIIDAGAGDRIFDIDPAGAGGITVTLSDLTVQNGSAMSGGAIYNTGTLTLTNVTVSSSDSLSGTENGGGIKNAPGAVLDMTGGELKSNRSFNFGGGLYNNGGTATFTNVAIHSNTADGSGGGIYNTGTLTMTGSDCHTNTSSASAFSAGGGCLFNTSTGVVNAVTVEKTVVRNNTANNGTGGGIRNEATMTLKNVTVSGNSATMGGGFYHFSGTATLRNVTLASNSVTTHGGGVKITGGTVNAYNTLIGDNTITAGTEDSHDCLGTLTSKGYNLVENTSGCTLSDDTTGNITGQDPALGALANGTHALSATSPAIDAGNPSTPGSTDASCETTDQDGIARPQGAACDIGAYERQQATNGGDDDDSGGDGTGDDDDSGDGGDDDDEGDDDDSGDPTGGAGTGDDDDDDGVSTHGQGGTVDCARNLDRADQRKDGAPSLMLAGMALALLAFRRRFPPP